MIYYKKIIFICILLYFILRTNLWNINKIKFINLFELIEYNIKLYLIKNAGLTDLNNNGSKLLQTLTDDTMLIKMHRRLHHKYGSVVLTYIISKTIHYYILDPNLAKSILQDSPKLFSAGKIKEDFFVHALGFSI